MAAAAVYGGSETQKACTSKDLYHYKHTNMHRSHMAWDNLEYSVQGLYLL